MQTGVVQSYNEQRGYGFIWCASVVGNFAYLEEKEYKAAGCPKVDTQVSFKLQTGPDGQARALDVKVAWERLRDIRKQVEWYFSDASLSTDEFFHRKITEAAPEGWLPVTLLLRCRKIQALNANAEMIYHALQESHLIVQFLCSCQPCRNVSNHLHVRRRQPLPPFVGKQHRNIEGKVVEKPEEKVANGDPNQTLTRLKDQRRVQDTLGLKEVGDDSTIFRARQPKEYDKFLGPVIAHGYERVIYGDHGPYIEFNEGQINWQAWPHFHDKSRYGDKRFYDEYFTVRSNQEMQRRWYEEGSNSREGVLMLYAQIKSVDEQPWAPGATTGISRPSGYADYRAGCFYVAADSTLITIDASENAAVFADPAIQSVTSRVDFIEGMKDKVCWRWQHGRCWKGSKCQWLHVDPTLEDITAG